MIIDDRLEFCDAQALNTGAAGTYNIGDQIDIRALGGPGNLNLNPTVDLEGADLYLIARVATAATSGGSATLQLRLVSDTAATPSTSAPAGVHMTSAVIPVASLTVGTTVLAGKLPSGSYSRYLGVQQITGTAAFTAGALDVFLTNDPALWRAYADNVA